MYTYKDLEQLTGLSNNALRQWQFRGILDGEGRPTLFDEVDAIRAVWLVTLMRFHMPLDEANALFIEALKQGIKDPGVVMLLTPEGTKFISDKEKLAHQPIAFNGIRIGAFIVEVKAELEAIGKVSRYRIHLGLDSEPLQAVH
jgi:hypothetical protein